MIPLKKNLMKNVFLNTIFNAGAAYQTEDTITQTLTSLVSKGKNLVLITHYSIITAVTTAVPSSGEMVITDKNFKVLGTIQTD